MGRLYFSYSLNRSHHDTGGYSILKESKMDSLATAFTIDYHTADMMPVFAYGSGAQMFSGIYDNTAIFYKMKKALKGK